MLADLLAQGVPFAVTTGIRVLEAGPDGGRARITNHDPVQNHLGSLHAAATFGVAETASGAAILGVLAERLFPGGNEPPVRAVVADADITYWRPATGTVVATATIDTADEATPTADELVRRRNVSVTVALADEQGQAIGRAAFHWVITARSAGTGPVPRGDDGNSSPASTTDSGA